MRLLPGLDIDVTANSARKFRTAIPQRPMIICKYPFNRGPGITHRWRGLASQLPSGRFAKIGARTIPRHPLLPTNCSLTNRPVLDVTFYYLPTTHSAHMGCVENEMSLIRYPVKRRSC